MTRGALIAIMALGIGLALGRPWQALQAAPEGGYSFVVSDSLPIVAWRQNATTGQVSVCTTRIGEGNRFEAPTCTAWSD